MSDEHINSNNYLKGRFVNPINNVITDITNNWEFKVEMVQTNEDSVYADTISVLTFLNQLAEENEELIEELQEFKSYSKALVEELSLANRDNTALEKENEELKTQNNAYLQDIEVFKEENTSLKLYKNAVQDVLLSWSQKDLTAKQLQVVIAIMEELNIEGNLK